jgi:hypothetical protein
MVRQAHTYLVGAMSGATLIAIAIAVFVVLVSAQVFRDWPIAALSGGGNETAAVSSPHPAGGAASSTAGGPGVVTAGLNAGRAGKPAGSGDHGHGSVAASDGIGSSDGGQATATEPSESAGGGDRSDGSGTAASPQSPSSSNPSGTTGSSSSGGSTGSGGGGATGGGGGSTGGTASTPSAQVTETVNNTVSKVDETALGGTLHEAGVTEVTESVVNGVAGPESTVGKVVNETVGALGGLLHGNR